MAHHAFKIALLGLLALSACSGEDGVVIEPSEPRDPDEFLTVMERFELAYIGRWEEDGNCEGTEETLRLGENSVSYAGRVCDTLELSMGTALVRATADDCTLNGEPDTAHTYVLDLAGDDILYVEIDGGPRMRMERCPER